MKTDQTIWIGKLREVYVTATPEKIAVLRQSLEAVGVKVWDRPPPDPVVEEDYLDTSEAAKLLSVSEITLRSWVRTGQLQSTRLNGRHRFKRSDLLAKITTTEGESK